ncbi:MAG: hypothetical protein OYH76_24750 [Defluviicoccus sp.]|nr:hypothetical protein [Defluviicoccus sp.]MDE0279118.1 hypothetical protein [Defluviicoccus sp.]
MEAGEVGLDLVAERAERLDETLHGDVEHGAAGHQPLLLLRGKVEGDLALLGDVEVDDADDLIVLPSRRRCSG